MMLEDVVESEIGSEERRVDLGRRDIEDQDEVG